MALNHDERSNSPELVFELGRTSARRSWWLGYSENEGEVLARARSLLPLVFAGEALQKFRLTHTGGGVWDLEANWGQAESRDQVQVQVGVAASISWDTTGGTTHITQALKHVADYGRPLPPGVQGPLLPPPNFMGAIGVDDDSVEGLDVTSGAFTWTETHFLPPIGVTWDYLHTLREMTGSVNSRLFRNRFAEGEVQFLGSTGTAQDLTGITVGRDPVEATFRFSAKPNAGLFVVGDIEVTQGKQGWDFLWVRFADVNDMNAVMRIKRPSSVHVEQVLPRQDFARLGIGA